MRRSTLGLSLLTAGLAIFLTCGQAGADQFKPSQSQQVRLGKQAADELRRRGNVLPSTDPRVKEVRDIGAKLLSTVTLHGEPWKFSFDVIDDRKSVNAFALPGGPMFVYTGLLDKLKTEDELAGVMGHELTHVLREHWAYAYADSMKRDLLLTLGLSIFHANADLQNLTGALDQFVFDLPFSRKHESEADEGGFDKVVAAGYNPQGEADVFAMLRDLTKGGAPPQWASDHPDDSKRIQHIQDLISKSGKTFPSQRPLPWPPPVDPRYQVGQGHGGTD